MYSCALITLYINNDSTKNISCLFYGKPSNDRLGQWLAASSSVNIHFPLPSTEGR